MDLDSEAGCENLMIKTVESRKHFKKLCKEYYQKQSIMENKLLNLQTEVCANISFKKKHPIPNIQEDVDTLESFLIENSEKQVKYQEFMEKIKNLNTIVEHLKKDTIGKILREPLNLQTMLARAKEKHSA